MTKPTLHSRCTCDLDLGRVSVVITKVNEKTVLVALPDGHEVKRHLQKHHVLIEEANNMGEQSEHDTRGEIA